MISVGQFMSDRVYKDFIEEAFISPIRSVLILDDDYPTFSEVLNSQRKRNEDMAGAGSHEGAPASPDEPFEKKGSSLPKKKGWYTHPEKIENFLERLRKNNVLIDIHDGSNISLGTSEGEEEKIIGHLHQSDLLVLDYHLDGIGGASSKAIKIARTVVNKSHFNLVAIHTSEDLRRAFVEILFALLAPFPDKPEGLISEGKALIEAAEEEDEKVLANLEATISSAQYLYARQHVGSFVKDAFNGVEPFKNFHELAISLGWEGKNFKCVLYYLLDNFEKKNEINNNVVAGLQWSGLESEKLWIRSDSVFFAFVSKGDDVDILQGLLDSLGSWGPNPSRLFLTKLRAEMAECGAAAEDLALNNKMVLARWYLNLLKCDPLGRKHIISEAISRNSEQLLTNMRSSVEVFADRLVNLDMVSGANPEVITNNHYDVDLSDDAKLKDANVAHNAFVCSKKPEGWHLTTGHIFKAGDNYWVCLSPLCDLVPNQKDGGIYKDVSGHMPFMAVRLREISGMEFVKPLSNRFIFTQGEAKISIFCINDAKSEGSLPHWYTLFATNSGVLENLEFKVLKTGKSPDGSLKIEQWDAKIVAQLRYEYALNLLHQLGNSLTRVGLDFIDN